MVRSRRFRTSSTSTAGSVEAEDVAAAVEARRGINQQVTRDQIDPLARQLNMRGRGEQDLVAFLRALDDPDFDRSSPGTRTERAAGRRPAAAIADSAPTEG